MDFPALSNSYHLASRPHDVDTKNRRNNHGDGWGEERQFLTQADRAAGLSRIELMRERAAAFTRRPRVTEDVFHFQMARRTGANSLPHPLMKLPGDGLTNGGGGFAGMPPPSTKPPTLKRGQFQAKELLLLDTTFDPLPDVAKGNAEGELLREMIAVMDQQIAKASIHFLKTLRALNQLAQQDDGSDSDKVPPVYVFD